MSDTLPLSKTLSSLRELMTVSGIRLTNCLGPLVILLFAALLEGISMALLIPLLRGIITSDFSFVMDLPVLGEITRSMPTYFTFGNRNFVILLVLLTFIAALMKIFLQFIANYQLGKVVRLFEHRLREQLFERYLSFGKYYFDSQNSGHMVQVIASFVRGVAGTFSPILQSFYATIILAIYIGIMYFISWELTLIVLLIFPVSHYTLKMIIQKIKRTSSDLMKRSLELGKQITNMVSGITLIKAYTYEKKEQEQFSQLSETICRMQISMDKKLLVIAPIQEALSLFWLFVLVGVIAFLLSKDASWNVAGFMVFLVILRRCSVQFGIFNNFRSAIAEISGIIGHLIEVFQDEDKFFIEDGKTACPEMKEAVRISNLSYRYPGGVEATRQLSLEIRKGKVSALVGHSGAGKSTLIHLLMRFYDPPAGTIFIDDIDIRSLSLRSWRARIALVSQDAVLFNGTLRENLLYGIDNPINNTDLDSVLERARLEEIVRRLPAGLSTEVGDKGVKLSGGERQRVAIARAFLKKAELLLLDEATSALDSKTEELVQQALADLMKERTTLVIAHRLSTIRHADTIYVLDNGSVLEQGTLDELLKMKGVFHSYWETQKFY